MDKYEANEILRYSIKTLRGEAFNARSGILIAHAIMAKDRLIASGFWWQADKLDIWINRFTAQQGRPNEIGGTPHAS